MTTSISDYAGDLDPQEAWSLLQSDANAQLVDVRTTAEWSFVGVPDIAGLNRDVHFIEWQSYPSAAIDAKFAERVSGALKATGADKNTAVLFLCRSGARSRAAAVAVTAMGFRRAYNVAGGFEGDLDPDRHRGRKNGWKACGLPWRQS